MAARPQKRHIQKCYLYDDLIVLLSYITKCVKVQWNLMAEMCTRL